MGYYCELVSRDRNFCTFKLESPGVHYCLPWFLLLWGLLGSMTFDVLKEGPQYLIVWHTSPSLHTAEKSPQMFGSSELADFLCTKKWKANCHLKLTSVDLSFGANVTTSLCGTPAKRRCPMSIYQNSAMCWRPQCKRVVITKLSAGCSFSQGWDGLPWCICFITFLAAAVFAFSVHQSVESSFQYF